MKLEKKLEELNIIFSKCGNGVRIMCIDEEGDRWRIYRYFEDGSRVNWVKCKNILNKKGIEFIDGDSGNGKRMSRCIDFKF